MLLNITQKIMLAKLRTLIGSVFLLIKVLQNHKKMLVTQKQNGMELTVTSILAKLYIVGTEQRMR